MAQAITMQAEMDIAALAALIDNSNSVMRRMVDFYENFNETTLESPQVAKNFCETMSSMQQSTEPLDCRIVAALEANPEMRQVLKEKIEVKQQLLRRLASANKYLLHRAEDRKLLLRHELGKTTSARNAAKGYRTGSTHSMKRAHLNKTF